MASFSEKTTAASDGTSLYYRDYAPQTPVADMVPVVCLHGLTRSSTDFESLAARLSQTHRVICPDLRGRGKSGYAADPMTYVPIQYVKDLKILLADADLSRFAIVGTSLGGILAMTMAGTMGHRIVGVVMNDIGPEIDPAGLVRINGYVGVGGPVDSWSAAADAVRHINEDALPHYTEEQWLALAKRHYVERGGKIMPNYDENIRVPFEASGGTPAPNMWPFFEALQGLPLLLIRGETSDILSERTADEMIRRHGSASYLEVPGVGHAPMLDELGVEDRISTFLRDIPGRESMLGWLKSRFKSWKELGRITKTLKSQGGATA
ncbi:MAG: alpha/beta fold hydrolase [Sphingomonadales bacterium]